MHLSRTRLTVWPNKTTLSLSANHCCRAGCLADSIDRAIAAGSAENPQPILLGKAGEIARQLSAAVMEGIERNRTYIVDCMIKFSVFAAGFSLLHAIGVDSYIAGAVAALMNVKLPKGEDAKK